MHLASNMNIFLCRYYCVYILKSEGENVASFVAKTAVVITPFYFPMRGCFIALNIHKNTT